MFFCYAFVFVFFVRRLPSLNYKFAHVRACWYPFWLFYLSSLFLFLLFLGYWAPKFIKFSFLFFNQISTWLEWRQFCWFPVQSVTVSVSLFLCVWERKKAKNRKMFISKKMVNCQCNSNIKWKYKRNLFINFDFCFNSLSLSLSFIAFAQLACIPSNCQLFGSCGKPLRPERTTKSHRWQLGIGLWQFHFLFNLIRRF